MAALLGAERAVKVEQQVEVRVARRARGLGIGRLASGFPVLRPGGEALLRLAGAQYPDKLGLAALPVPVMQLGRVRSARVSPHALGLPAAQRPEPFFQALQVPLVAALAALF